jgi:hypothetical protein
VIRKLAVVLAAVAFATPAVAAEWASRSDDGGTQVRSSWG